MGDRVVDASLFGRGCGLAACTFLVTYVSMDCEYDARRIWWLEYQLDSFVKKTCLLLAWLTVHGVVCELPSAAIGGEGASARVLDTGGWLLIG